MSSTVTHLPPERTLDNGLSVIVVPKHDVPVVTTLICYHVGSVDEAEDETGLAHFLEHMMFKGTDRYAVGEIDHLTQTSGGSNNALTSYDYTAYYLDLPRETWQTALDVESNRMSSCTFVPEEVENERTVVLSELDGGRDDPGRALYEEIGSLAYKVHPYHHPIIGWRSVVESVSREKMFDFYRRHYQPQNATLVIVGDVQPEAAFEAAESRFAALPAGTRDPRSYTPEPEQEGERRLVLHPSDSHVDRLAIAYRSCRVGEPNDWALDVLSTVLTGGRSSRFHRRLVEEQQLASGVQTSNDTRLFPGLFTVSAAVAPGVEPARLEAALDDELERVLVEPLSAAELERARSILESAQLFSQQTTGDIAYLVGSFAALGDHSIFFRYLEELAKVTIDDVQRAADRTLRRASRTVGWSLKTAGNGDDGEVTP